MEKSRIAESINRIRRKMKRLTRSDELGSAADPAGILNERVLVLVFNSINWDIHSLCYTASVSRKLRAIAKRLLWRQACIHRAPGMTTALTTNSARIGGGWDALAKLLFFCGGCESTRHFPLSQPVPGHFLRTSRFSKTSGRSFLTRKCLSDLLYVSDPCEHRRGGRIEEEDDLGVYRGVFKEFMKSRTRACLIARKAELEERVRCPYCGARVWSMTSARLAPRSAARRLGSREREEGGLEFFVCVNGHLYGACWLIPLSSSSSSDDHHDMDGGDEDGDCPYDDVNNNNDEEEEEDCSSSYDQSNGVSGPSGM